jgi:tetratricopeptide (TPR) repeat protein
VGRDRGSGSDLEADGQRDQAAQLAAEGERLIGELLKPGRWPQSRTIAKFLESDRLPKVLMLYQAAMRLDPEEVAYPWNLASSLSRLGLNSLALAYVEEAIRLASETDEAEWADAQAHVAWADIAIRARQFDVALVALARARRLGRRQEQVDEQVQRLLEEIRKAHGSDRPAESLARELEGLSA